MEYINDLVSIIMPAYNVATYIRESLSSIISQTYTNWEVIVIDDCSTDNTSEVVLEIAKQNINKRIHLIINNRNLGVVHARNSALLYAKGNYIAFLDSDDLWLNDKLEKQLTFMINNNYAFTYTSYEYMSETGFLTNKNVSIPLVLSYNDILKNTVIGCSTVIINRNKVGDFQMPELEHGEDTFTWYEIMRRGFLAYGLQDSLTYYRLATNSLTRNKIKVARIYWRNLREYANYSLLHAATVFMKYAINAIKKRI